MAIVLALLGGCVLKDDQNCYVNQLILIRSHVFSCHHFKGSQVDSDLLFSYTGNDNIHELTSDSNHAMMILMTDFSGVTKFAEYLSFHVSSEDNNYSLMVSKYDGTAG